MSNGRGGGGEQFPTTSAAATRLGFTRTRPPPRLCEPVHKLPGSMTRQSATAQIRSAITEGRRDGGSFFGSVVAGTLLGLGIDAWLDTAPVVVIVGIVLGSYAGFARAWQEVKSQPTPPAVTLLDEDAPR